MIVLSVSGKFILFSMDLMLFKLCVGLLLTGVTTTSTEATTVEPTSATTVGTTVAGATTSTGVTTVDTTAATTSTGVTTVDTTAATTATGTTSAATSVTSGDTTATGTTSAATSVTATDATTPSTTTIEPVNPPVVVEFQSDPNDPNDWGYLRQQVQWGRVLNSFTICLRFMITSVDDDGLIPLISYSHPNTSFAELQMVIDWKSSEIDFKCCNYRVSKKIQLEESLRLLDWESLCLAINFDYDVYTIVHKNTALTENLNALGSNPVIADQGVMIVGKLQHQYDGGFSGSLRGSIGRLAIMAQKVVKRDMMDFVNDCNKTMSSSLLGFNVLADLDDWQKLGSIEPREVQNNETFCLRSEFQIILPGMHTHNDSRLICSHLSGFLAYPLSPADQDDIKRKFNQRISACTNIYGAWLWIDVYYRYENGGWNFVSRRNRFERRTQCISLKPASYDWLDVPCEETLCAVCESSIRPQLTLRGGCQVITERQFMFTYGSDDEPSLINSKGTTLYWNNENVNWYLKVYGSNDVIAWLMDSTDRMKSTLPLGKRVWQFNNGVGCVPSSDELLLSVCNLNQFACDNGIQCYPWSVRCNHVKDCSDGSDEENCPLQSISTSAMEGIQPPSLELNDTFYITLDIQYMDIGISLKPMQFCSVSFALEWHDPRVTMYNLQSSYIKIDEGLVWRPQVAGSESEKATTLISTREEEHMAVVRKESVLDGNMFTQNVEYSGSANILRLSGFYHIEYPCTMDLWYFPFAYKRCHFAVIIKNLDETRTDLIIKNSKQEILDRLKQQVNDYKVTRVEVRHEIIDNFPAIVFYINISHQTNMVIGAVYLPSLLILVVMYGMLFIPIYKTMIRLLTILTCLFGLGGVYWIALTYGIIPYSAAVIYLDLWFFVLFLFGSLALMSVAAVWCFLSKIDDLDGSGRVKWNNKVKGIEIDVSDDYYLGQARLISLVAKVILGIGLVAILVWYCVQAALHVKNQC